MISLNQLLRQIRAVANAHSQINTYAEGQKYDFSASNAIVYPCLWVVPMGATNDLAGKKIDYRFTLVMMDIEQSGGENQIEILSDTALMLTDIVAQLENTSNATQEWQVGTLGNYEPFVDSFLDTVSGHSCELTLSTYYSSDTCTDILEGYNPPYNTEVEDSQSGQRTVRWGNITGTLSDQTDLQDALNEKVPYNNAVDNVNLGGYNLTANEVSGVIVSDLIKPINDSIQISDNTNSKTIIDIYFDTNEVFVGDWRNNKPYLLISDNGVGVNGSFGLGGELYASNSEGSAGDILTSGGLGNQPSWTPAPDLSGYQLTSAEDASGGYVGLTLFKINFKNVLNTFTSYFTNSNTASRTYTFQDRNGTIADDTDLGTKQDTLVSGTNIKTINSNSILGSGNILISSAVAWGAVTGTLSSQTDLQDALNLKVDKVSGKGLSTEDYTSAEKTKLSGIQTGAEVNVNADWNATSGDAEILNKPTIPSIAGLESTSNKSTSVTTDQASNTKYPSVKAVYDWVIGLGYLLASTASSTYQTLANIRTSWQVTPDNTHYPSEKLVKDSLDAKQGALTLTTTGTSGASTLVGSTLNIPQYSGGGGGGSGTVTSVAVTVPSGLSVSGSPITSAGTIAITGAGTTAEYLDGTGALQTFPTLTGADKMETIGRNSTGSTLYKGTVVYISGSTGNRPNFVKSQANSESTSAGTFGVVMADIANNADGNVVTIGTIETLDTRSSATHPFTSDTLADGDTIYLSPTTAGYITNVKPSAPNHMVYVGKVVRTSPTHGTIVYRIQNGYELDEIHDVSIVSKTDRDLLMYESATTLWKNKTLVKGDVGLGNVDNTSDANKPVSTATQTALNSKQDTLVSGTNIKTINTVSLLGSSDISLPTTSSTDTFTNKRITSRVSSVTSSATPSVNTDSFDAVTITALAATITGVTVTGTPTDFQRLIFRIKDNGTARGITWGASFEAKGVALPTTTVISKVLTVGFIYDSVSTKWGCVASAQQA